MQVAVNTQYDLTTAALASSLKDVCSNFHADEYLNVKASDSHDFRCNASDRHATCRDIFANETTQTQNRSSRMCAVIGGS